MDWMEYMINEERKKNKKDGKMRDVVDGVFPKLDSC